MKQKTSIKTRLQVLPALFILLCTLAVPLIHVAPAFAAANCQVDIEKQALANFSFCLAQDRSTYAKMNPSEQVRSYLYATAMAHCASSNSSLATVKQSEIAAGNPFKGISATVHIGTSITGTTERDGTGASNGQTDCDMDDIGSGESTSNWVSKAIGMWGWTSFIQFACDTGAVRTSGNKNCTEPNNDSYDWPYSGNAYNKMLAAIQVKAYGANSLDLTNVQNYALYHDSFTIACKGEPKATVAAASADIAGAAQMVKMMDVDATGNPVEMWYYWPETNSDEIDQYLGVYRPGGVIKIPNPGCIDVAKKASEYVGAYAQYVKFQLADSSIPAPNLASTGCDLDSNGICAASDDTLNCNNGSFNWIICPAITIAAKAVNTLDSFIMNTLDVDIKPIFDETTVKGSASNGYYTAWNSFRIIAVALLIIAGLVMVASQALGFELLDAYTIRKTLPRLLVAIIGISLSWELMRFVVGFFDTVGFDIRSLMYAPFKEFGGTITVGTGILTTLGVGAVIFLNPASLTFIITALLAVLVGYIILVMRQIAIIMLIIVAPVAIACSVLPNTQKVWKLWFDNFMGLMLMFPIISGLIAAGHIFSAVALKGGGINNSGSLAAQALAIIAYFLPYFLLPLAARMATGVIGNLAGFVNDRGKGVFDRLSKHRADSGQRRRHAMSQGTAFNNRALNAVTSRVTTPGFGFGRRGKAAYQQKMDLAAAEHGQSARGKAVQHHDAVVRAQTFGSASEARRGLREEFGMDEEAISDAIAGARANGGWGRARQIWAAQQLAVTGTGYDNMRQATRTIARVSHGNANQAASLAGNINAITKPSRHDLAPGAGTLIELSQAEMGAMSGTRAPIPDAAYHDASVLASRGGDAVTLLRGKPIEVRNLTQALMHQHVANPNDQQLENQIADLMGAMQYASPENQQIVRESIGTLAIPARYPGQGANPANPNAPPPPAPPGQ